MILDITAAEEELPYIAAENAVAFLVDETKAKQLLQREARGKNPRKQRSTVLAQYAHHLRQVDSRILAHAPPRGIMLRDGRFDLLAGHLRLALLTSEPSRQVRE